MLLRVTEDATLKCHPLAILDSLAPETLSVFAPVRIDHVSPASVLNRFRWLAAALIVVATFAAYANTLSAPLIFDDASSLTHNPSIRSLWPIWAVFTPPSECTVAGRPFANLTFALN